MPAPKANKNFEKQNVYNLIRSSDFLRLKVHSEFHGKESISYLLFKASSKLV